jgi:F-type H+-transporting ATPase subunit epsilon
MKLKVWVPTEVVFDQEVTKIKAEAENGWFGILPRHVDFVTSLVPGILSFELPGNQTEYLAIDHGVFVKCGPAVSVSTRNAVRGADLGALKEAVQKQFRTRYEKEQAARAFEAKLEADLVRQLMQMEKYV